MSDAQRRAILEAAAKDKDLAGLVPPVVAAGFGVLPLRRLGDVLTVACLPRMNRRALRMLRDVLGLEIVATPFDDRALHEAIEAAYFDDDDGVNYPTFLDPDFLEDPRNAPVLREEKQERPGDGRLELPKERLALAALGYRSALTSLDGPRSGQGLPDPARTKLELGELAVGWSRDARGVVRVEAPDGVLAPDVALVLTEYRENEFRHVPHARVSEHSVKASLLAHLPHVIHPTEVQLVAVERDGALGLHLYDHVEQVAPDGPPRRFALAYHFLSYGVRLHRTIEVVVHQLTTVARGEVEVHNHSPAWGPTELERWLGVAPVV